MKFEFWGVRGTFPISSSEGHKYGGNTPSALIVPSGGELIIVDAGTGIKQLGDKLMKNSANHLLTVHILLTHFHLDHIMGIPFFAPLYSRRTNIIFYAVCDPEETKKYLSRLMIGKYFPVKFEDSLSRKKFKKIPEGIFEIGTVRVSSCPLHHPQESVAYKIQEHEDNLIFATDTEHTETGIDERLASFSEGADVLVYDATFTPEEYNSKKRGWGHSTWLAGTILAKEAVVKNLYLSHFNPDYSDKQIDNIISNAKSRFFPTFGAIEKSWIKKED